MEKKVFNISGQCEYRDYETGETIENYEGKYVVYFNSDFPVKKALMRTWIDENGRNHQCIKTL